MDHATCGINFWLWYRLIHATRRVLLTLAISHLSEMTVTPPHHVFILYHTENIHFSLWSTQSCIIETNTAKTRVTCLFSCPSYDSVIALACPMQPQQVPCRILIHSNAGWAEWDYLGQRALMENMAVHSLYSAVYHTFSDLSFHGF